MYESQQKVQRTETMVLSIALCEVTIITIVDLSLFLEGGICIIFLIVSNILARQGLNPVREWTMQKTVKSGLGIVSLFGNMSWKHFQL